MDYFAVAISAVLISLVKSADLNANRCGQNLTDHRGVIARSNQTHAICHWRIDVDDHVLLHLNISLWFPDRICDVGCTEGYLQYGVYDWQGRHVVVDTVCGHVQGLYVNLEQASCWFTTVLVNNRTESGFNLTYEAVPSSHMKNTVVVGLCFGVAMPFVFIAPALFYCHEKKKKNPSYIRKQELREIYRLKQQEQERRLKNNPVDRKLMQLVKHPPTLPPFGKDIVSPESSCRSVKFFNTGSRYGNRLLDDDNNNNNNRNNNNKKEGVNNSDAVNDVKIPAENQGYLSDQGSDRLVVIEGLPTAMAASKNNLLGELSTSNIYADLGGERRPSESGLTPEPSFGFEPTKYEDMDDTYSKLPTPAVHQPKEATYLSLRNTPFIPPPPRSTRVSRRNPRPSAHSNDLVSSSSPALHNSILTPTNNHAHYPHATPLSALTDSARSVFCKQPLSQSTPDLMLSPEGHAPQIKVNDVTLLDLEKSASTSMLETM